MLVPWNFGEDDRRVSLAPMLAVSLTIHSLVVPTLEGGRQHAHFHAPLRRAVELAQNRL